ncbi:hypothetical protein HRG_013445 [Hirsutella rhossiliensis]
MVCYRKWRPLTIFMPELLSEGESVSVCAECGRCLARRSLSPAIHLHSRLGCEHMFPDELGTDAGRREAHLAELMLRVCHEI